MAITAYPTGADLVEFLETIGLEIEETQANKYVASAIEAFEDRTFRPFLAQQGENYTAGEVMSSVDGYRYDLDDIPVMAAGCVVSWLPDNGTEQTLVERTDYSFLPMNGGVNLKPYNLLKLKLPKHCGRVKIEGLFGYSTDLPQSVWDAIIQLAASYELRRIRVAMNASQGGDAVKRLKAASMEVEWFDTKVSSYESYFSEVCERYRY